MTRKCDSTSRAVFEGIPEPVPGTTKTVEFVGLGPDEVHSTAELVMWMWAVDGITYKISDFQKKNEAKRKGPQKRADLMSGNLSEHLTAQHRPPEMLRIPALSCDQTLNHTLSSQFHSSNG